MPAGVRRLMGMPLHAVSRAGAVQRVFDGIRDHTGGAVLTANVDVLRQYTRSPFLRAAFEQASLVVADGVPVVWALHLQGTPVPQRITGTDLLWALAGEAAGRGASVFLAGGRAGEAERAADRLARTYPPLAPSSFACFVEPGRPVAGQIQGLCAALSAAAPDLAFVGLPFVHQVDLIVALRPTLTATWFVGIGSSFEFLAGDRSRAPEWLQRMGLEWAYRLTQQPRLWRRYLLHGLPFAGRLGAHALAARLRGEGVRSPSQGGNPGAG
jgi:N-acetylglucosaminyldiphosphoundecaprenol N-acetyl-beta-D-mannosaminyltransferase